MAEAGLAPKYFAVRDARLGTPLRALLLQVVVIALLAGLDFAVIMCVDNFFSAAAAALEFAAAVRLRTSHPELERPFRIPLGTAGLTALLLVPFGIAVAVMFVTATHSLLSLALCTGATLVGGVLYVPWVHRPLEAGATSPLGSPPPEECARSGSMPSSSACSS